VWSPPALDAPVSFEAYSEDQPRDESGRWTDGGGGPMEHGIPSAPEAKDDPEYKSWSEERDKLEKEQDAAIERWKIAKTKSDTSWATLREVANRDNVRFVPVMGSTRMTTMDPELDKKYESLLIEHEKATTEEYSSQDARMVALQKVARHGQEYLPEFEQIQKMLTPVPGKPAVFLEADFQRKTGKAYTATLSEIADKRYAKDTVMAGEHSVEVLASQQHLSGAENSRYAMVKEVIEKNPDLFQSVKRIELHPTLAAYSFQLKKPDGTMETFKSGGHWHSEDGTIRIFGTIQFGEALITHEGAHSQFTEMDTTYKEGAERGWKKREDAQWQKDLEAKIAEYSIKRTNAKSELNIKYRDKLNKTAEDALAAKDRASNLRDQIITRSNWSEDPDKDPEYQTAVKEEKRLRTNYTRIKNKWGKEEKSINEKWDSNKLVEDEYAKSKGPVTTKMDNFRKAVDSERGVTTYANHYIEAHDDRRYTENWAETTAILRYYDPSYQEALKKDNPKVYNAYMELKDEWDRRPKK
jgi:hypothetical protein